MGPAVTKVMAGAEALLFGRRTWQTMAAAWPSRAGDPFADRMNEVPKYVASRTLTDGDLSWPGSTLLPPGDAIGAIRELQAQGGARDAMQVMGSASLAAQLIEHDLVDEYRLMIEPILLGGGKRIFPSGAGPPTRAGFGNSNRHRRAHLHLPPRLVPSGCPSNASVNPALWPGPQSLCFGPGHRWYRWPRGTKTEGGR